MDLRTLRYFSAVVREGHFGRAAASLGIAQPPLTRQIQKLERDLGVSLLQRTRKKFEVTPAGRLLYERAGRLLDGADQTEADVRRAGTGETGRLVIGFVHSNTFTILPGAVARFRAAYPDVEMDLREMRHDNLVAGLENGGIDVGLLRPPVSSRALQAVTLIHEPFLALVWSGHRLAARRTVQLGQFASEPFVMYSRIGAPLIHTRVMEMCKRAGFAPRIAQYADQIDTVASFVAAGIGVALAPSTVTSFNMPSLRCLRIADRPAPLAMGVMWRTGNASGLVRNFTRVAREAAVVWRPLALLD
ncbi:MAG: LysR family transcriptional regulator [Rhodospirillales bacterium]|nr:LysR family transcriptional regulator [Rhodospirillales bacterium]